MGAEWPGGKRDRPRAPPQGVRPCDMLTWGFNQDGTPSYSLDCLVCGFFHDPHPTDPDLDPASEGTGHAGFARVCSGSNNVRPLRTRMAQEQLGAEEAAPPSSGAGGAPDWAQPL